MKPWNKNQLTVNCVVPLVNVPFIKKSNFVKTVVIKKRTSSKLVIEFDMKTLDAPYGDTFSCKESWIILTTSRKQNRCVFQQFIKIDFVKSCMFKFKIVPRAEEGMIDTINKFHSYASKNGHFNKKQPSKRKQRRVIDPNESQIKVQSFESPNENADASVSYNYLFVN